jgi:hypothetical protein
MGCIHNKQGEEELDTLLYLETICNIFIQELSGIAFSETFELTFSKLMNTS